MVAGALALLFAVPSLLAGGTAATSPDEDAVRRIIADYAKAIENKDLALFKTLKPNLTKDEEERLRRSFASIQSQQVRIDILAVELGAAEGKVRVVRRDTIDRSLVASFPQTFIMVKVGDGWTIREIGR